MGTCFQLCGPMIRPGYTTAVLCSMDASINPFHRQLIAAEPPLVKAKGDNPCVLGPADPPSQPRRAACPDMSRYM